MNEECFVIYIVSFSFVHGCNNIFCNEQRSVLPSNKLAFSGQLKLKSHIEFDILFKYVSQFILSYDVTSGSEKTPCNKIDKPLVVYRFTGNVMTSITTLHT